MAPKLEGIAVIALTVTSLVLAGIAVEERFFPRAAPLVAEGESFPSFVVSRETGDTVDLASTVSPGLVVFFSSGCAFCEAALPTYEVMASQNCDHPITLVFVDLDIREIEEWSTRDGRRLHETCAEVEYVQAISRPRGIGVYRTPTHVMLNQSGEVTLIAEGGLQSVPGWYKP